MSNDDDRKSSTVSRTKLAVFVVVGYLIPILLTFLDEVVFRTFFIWNATPDWGRKVIEVVYFPLKLILQTVKHLRN